MITKTHVITFTIMDIPDYTSSIGRKLKIQYSFILTYSVILLGLGIYCLVRYNIYSETNYPECQYGDLKTNTYIISIGNLFVGFILACSSLISFAATRDWSHGQITTYEYWHNFYHEHNSLSKIILFVLQLGVIGFATSNIFRVFDPSGCDPYLYYVLIANVYILYNIVLIGIAIYIAGYFVINLLGCLFELIRGYFQSCCGNNLIILIGNFGLFNRGRVGRQISPIRDHRRLDRVAQTSIPIEVDSNNQNIPRIIPELVEFGTSDDCPVCIDPQKKGVKFGHCTHWVCEVCWSQIMNTNPVCPLCRAQII